MQSSATLNTPKTLKNENSTPRGPSRCHKSQFHPKFLKRPRALDTQSPDAPPRFNLIKRLPKLTSPKPRDPLLPNQIPMQNLPLLPAPPQPNPKSSYSYRPWSCASPLRQPATTDILHGGPLLVRPHRKLPRRSPPATRSVQTPGLPKPQAITPYVFHHSIPAFGLDLHHTLDLPHFVHANFSVFCVEPRDFPTRKAQGQNLGSCEVNSAPYEATERTSRRGRKWRDSRR